MDDSAGCFCHLVEALGLFASLCMRELTLLEFHHILLSHTDSTLSGFVFVLFVFETGSLCVTALAVLELTL